MEDAFRSADRDFDGFINKNDLRLFLIEVIKIQEKEITSPRIDRLFKLMDQFKRGCVQFLDFKRIFTENFNTANNLNISGFKKLFGTNTFGWKINARQQIGLILSREFNTLLTSFEGRKIKKYYLNLNFLIHINNIYNSMKFNKI